MMRDADVVEITRVTRAAFFVHIAETEIALMAGKCVSCGGEMKVFTADEIIEIKNDLGLAAAILPHWFSDDLFASDLGVFLLPGCRGDMTAVRLVKAYIEWAKFRGALTIQLGISTGVQVDETAALYRRLGLKEFSIGFEV